MMYHSQGFYQVYITFQLTCVWSDNLVEKNFEKV